MDLEVLRPRQAVAFSDEHAFLLILALILALIMAAVAEKQILMDESSIGLSRS